MCSTGLVSAGVEGTSSASYGWDRPSPGGPTIGLMKRTATIVLVVSLALTGLAPQPSGAGEEWKPKVGLAKRYAERREGSISFAIKDAPDRFFGHHVRRVVPAASVFKAMILAAYLRRTSVRSRGLTDEERSRLSAMIRWSDNDSATILLDRMGHRAIHRLARDAHMKDFQLVRPWGLSHVSAGDQVRFFFRFHRYVPARHEEYARWLLHHIVRSQRWGITDVELDGWKRFFKSGWATGTGRVSHQVAWIQKDGDRVAIAVMTEYSPSHEYSKRTLQGVMHRLLKGLPNS